MTEVWAHQRLIREQKAAADPRPCSASLDAYSLEIISRQDARPLIEEYEWLGNIGRSVHFVGLLSPGRVLHGVACFGYGPAGAIRRLIGEPALCLERGACTHDAPPNAASFLINRACKMIYRTTGVARFFAYGDPAAGEYGAVYQAAGWLYLGQGLDGASGRRRRYFVLPPGMEDRPANWRTTRSLRRGPRLTWLTFAQARARGWVISDRPAKFVYAFHAGHERDRRRWRADITKLLTNSHGAPLPFPAPRPHLKRKRKFALATVVPAQEQLF